MRDQFIAGAGLSYNPAASGGAISHTHEFTANGHEHAEGILPAILDGSDFDSLMPTEPIVGTTNSGNGLPKYYSLAYIMKS